MTEAVLQALRKDLEGLINRRVIVREQDNTENQGTIIGVGQILIEMMDEVDNRVVRLRLDFIRSIDDPPDDTKEEKLGKVNDD